MTEWTFISSEGLWPLIPGVILGAMGILCAVFGVFSKDIKTINGVRAAATIGFICLLAAAILIPIGINKDTFGNSLTSLPEGSYQLVGVFKIDSKSADRPGPHLHVVIRGAALEQKSVELPIDAYILVDGQNVSSDISSFPDAFMRGGMLKVYHDNQERLEKKGGHEWRSAEIHTQKIKVYQFIGATAYPHLESERDTPD